MKRRILSFLTALAFCLSLLLALDVPAAAADEAARADTTKDAFGITMEGMGKTESNKKNNPYGTENWFTLFNVSELSVAQCDNGGGWIQNYNFNPDNKVGSIGAIFGNSSNKEPGNNKDYDFVLIDTAACDPTGCGQQDHTAVLAYQRNHNNVILFLLDKNGNKVYNDVIIGDDETTYFMEETKGYGSNSFLSVAAGDFNGDGKETLAVYVPLMRSKTKDPILKEYELQGNTLQEKNTIVSNIWTLLGIKDISAVAGSNHGKTRQNAPAVQMVAADTDKDSVDELVVTISMNNCTDDSVTRRASHLYIFDLHMSGWEKTYNHYMEYTAGKFKGIRWATSDVGNVQSVGSIDYPEIVTAGWAVKDDNGGGVTHNIGSVITSCTKTETGDDGVAVGTYSSQQVEAISGGGSEFTKGGHFCNDAVPGLLQVRVFDGYGPAETATVLISDTVYTFGSANKWEYAFRDKYFNDDDDGIGGSAITNGVIIDAVAANFDGNTEGRGQVVFGSLQKRSGQDRYYVRLYTYQADQNRNWRCDTSSYISYGAARSNLSLTAPDIDQDSTIARIKDISKTYTEPSVLAMLEAPPYFSELEGGDTGNSETAFGKSTTTGGGSIQSNGISASVITGFEWNVDDSTGGFACGVGFEASVENGFTWENEKETTTTYELNYSNDTGENQVILYRRPVWTYQYEIKDHPGENMVQIRQGDLATNMITVEEYNELAGHYNLDLIADGVLGTAGDPFSYRNSTAGLDRVVISKDTAQYAGQGTVSLGFTNSTSTQDSYTYEMSASIEAYGLVFGAKVGAGAGFTNSSGAYTINAKDIAKSGAVTCKNYPGYDFQWRFAHWTVPLNGVDVPVLGYLLNNVAAPPSPPVGLAAEDVTASSAEIKWEHGGRSADSYYIYQYFPETGRRSQLAEVEGTENSYIVSNLIPNKTYHYVLRSYTAPKAGGGENGMSVDSEELALTTLPEGAKPVTIDKLENASARIGGTAVFRINASLPSSDYTSMDFQWQCRESGSWTDVEGAINATLRLANVTKEMDGSTYRCRVSPMYKGNLVDYYSNAAELKVGRDPADATLSVSGVSGSGTFASPYTGKADYQKQTGTNTSTVTTKQPATVTIDGADCPVYSIGSSCYAVLTGDAETAYYQVTKSGESYTQGSKLELQMDGVKLL